ncbi:glycosyltransferase family 4 protein [Zymomonas mobilis]|uniref:Glycosyl transferase group 1 n=1 Tax=Zymomonas mobilis subsp. pomaceae (strain ATCC 29192 / DSM 22645 / JCM 10191 / CCUG 17912 / NBRC 13757 / NCIMB 11200 / NRRL B-4491 / Barker I) TaxID=579138 RepID=F8EUX4_ZYMMT|nr:glycosyltransferase family 1 protein [Zymomonas mobilis]AEI37262.1 glycosyl transferase group 1 [Zymomonas mobilis subsp. pomaceae ATCC 29192]MDX5948631.1 glycosyltransferase family 1 protein [Zymomonas mobilis subsp. pomaceae]GEB88437.1 capsular polysaccharide glycosyltransferase biosynthesis protein [Zymomonas mobilis subsp. pomaceae]
MLPDREIILDLSRLLSRILHSTPTGVDRVEMAYARELMQTIPDHLHFAVVNIFGAYGRIPRETALSFLTHTEALWNGKITIPSKKIERLVYISNIYRRMWPRSVPPKPSHVTRIFLQSSPHHLTHKKLTASILKKEHAKFVCLLHDLIPIEFPEYARPDGAELHIKRLRTVAELADGIIANSYDTQKEFQTFSKNFGRSIPIITAHLGIDPIHKTFSEKNGQTLKNLFDIDNISKDHPIFICLGTIEPRKNHLLLLNIWRKLVQNYGDKAPYLILIGRRGWENENIVDMLERCPAIKKRVYEFSNLDDRQIQLWLKQARALLMPSFAEGYGLPIAEAINLNLPVICSDIPAHREVGGEVAEFLDPLDGVGWLDTILDYSQAESKRVKAQKIAMKEWQPPSWKTHISAVLQLVQDL